MPNYSNVPWVRKLQALKPRKGSFADSLLTIGKATSIIAGAKIEELLHNITRPNWRPGMKRKEG